MSGYSAAATNLHVSVCRSAHTLTSRWPHLVPGAHTKNGRDHGIPLAPLAASILNARPFTGPHYFPGRRSIEQPLEAGSLNRMRTEVQEETGTTDWTLRDIRRTFRSNMARLKVPRDVCAVVAVVDGALRLGHVAAIVGSS